MDLLSAAAGLASLRKSPSGSSPSPVVHQPTAVRHQAANVLPPLHMQAAPAMVSSGMSPSLQLALADRLAAQRMARAAGIQRLQLGARGSAFVSSTMAGQELYPAPNAKNFPEMLHEFVTSNPHPDILSWLPHGKGFVIHDKRRFVDFILPRYFDGAKYTSFTRRLKRWGFVRVTRGPETGAYYNQFFVRAHPGLVKRMKYRTDGQFDKVDEIKKQQVEAMAEASKDTQDLMTQGEDIERRIEEEVERRVRESLQGSSQANSVSPVFRSSPQASPKLTSLAPSANVPMMCRMITPPEAQAQQLSEAQRQALVARCGPPSLASSSAPTMLDRSAAYSLLVQAKAERAKAQQARSSPAVVASDASIASPSTSPRGPKAVFMSPAEEEDFARFLMMKRENASRLPMRKRVRCLRE